MSLWPIYLYCVQLHSFCYPLGVMLMRDEIIKIRKRAIKLKQRGLKSAHRGMFSLNNQWLSLVRAIVKHCDTRIADIITLFSFLNILPRNYPSLGPLPQRTSAVRVDSATWILFHLVLPPAEPTQWWHPSIARPKETKWEGREICSQIRLSVNPSPSTYHQLSVNLSGS